MVIDTNPFEWEHPSAPLKLNEALQHILAFMNAHLAGRHDNKLAVIASHVGVRYKENEIEWRCPSTYAQYFTRLYFLLL